MEPLNSSYGECGSLDHLRRRTLLKAAGLSGLTWLTPLADMLAVSAEKKTVPGPARSVILLWMGGAPSQLETFDPHPGKEISYGTTSIKTAVKGVELAAGLERTAEIMEDVSLIRSVVSREGDHARASYNIKTGYRPNPSVEHPSIGSIICHQLPNAQVQIPTHVSILPNQFPSRGGFLGPQYDPFQIGDPRQPLPDMKSRVDDARRQRRLDGLNLVEQAFARGRGGVAALDQGRTQHLTNMEHARRMMSSEQLKAFDVSEETESLRSEYGDTPFGRGCLAARRLVEAGVRCVEVTLNGWDTHVNNHELQAGRVAILDPAFTTLIRDLKQRDLLDSTVVLCGGEFGRTPKLNALDGRDHWPHGFSVALAGGGIAGGRVLGSTDPSGESKKPERPIPVQDIHATIQYSLGIDHELELTTPANRPIALSDGMVIDDILA